MKFMTHIIICRVPFESLDGYIMIQFMLFRWSSWPTLHVKLKALMGAWWYSSCYLDEVHDPHYMQSWKPWWVHDDTVLIIQMKFMTHITCKVESLDGCMMIQFLLFRWGWGYTLHVAVKSFICVCVCVCARCVYLYVLWCIRCRKQGTCV